MGNRKPLTAREVETLKARERAFEHMDPSCPGFGVRVGPRGTKAWIYRYRTQDRRLRRITLGRVGEMSLTDARAAWRREREVRDSGRDPLAVRKTAIAQALAESRAEDAQAARDEYFVATLAADYLSHVRGLKRTWREDERQLRVYVLPELGAMPVHAVTTEHVVAVLRAVRERGRVQANRTRALLHRVWTWGADEHRPGCGANPVAGTKYDGSAERPRVRVLTDGELRTLLLALPGDMGGDVLRWLLLTGCRLGEGCGLAWREVDREAGLWRLPAERAKGGIELVRPLSGAALALLDRRPRRGAHVFPSRAGGARRTDGQASWFKRHREELGAAGWRLHDLRRTVASGLARLGADREVVAFVLGHVDSSIVARHYDMHSRVEEARVALERWAAHLDALGVENVVAMERRA